MGASLRIFGREEVETDTSEFNEFILDAVLNKKPVFYAYKNLCRLLPDREIDYVNFEWKYYQFYNGNRDLTIVKRRENSSPLTFSDLSTKILEKVMEKADLVDRLVLRKVSPDLRKLVDAMEVYCERIDFRFGIYSSSIDVDWTTLTYEPTGYGSCIVSSDRKWRIPAGLPDTSDLDSECSWEICAKNQYAEERMIADAQTFLKNPKLKINELSLFVDEDVESDAAICDLLKFLKSLNFQLDVRSICNHSFGHITLPILQLLKAESLEKIDLETEELTAGEFDEVTKTAQWKRATELSCGFPKGLQAKHVQHFKNIEFFEFETNNKSVSAVRDILLRSSVLEWCNLRGYYLDLYDNVHREDFEMRFNRLMNEYPEYDLRTGRFSIPKSRDYFQFEVREDPDGEKILKMERMRGNQ